MPIVSAKKMLAHAFQNKYAIPHININNLEWTRAALVAAEKNQSPIIIATSEGALRYMGGYEVALNLVKNLHDHLKISVPVAFHLDHGSFEASKKAIESGFTSIMYDGSHEPFEVNYHNTQELMKLAANKDISVESEVGTIGGEEDGITGSGEKADPQEALKMSELGVDVVACGIGNVHGPYPKSWKSLDFTLLDKLSKTIQKGIVLHGGSGIPNEQVKKAISLGIAKVNVNTELQLANAAALKEFILSGKIDQGKNYDPRKIYASGIEAMIATVSEKMQTFGSVNQAKLS